MNLFPDPIDREQHDRMVALLEEMLTLHRHLAAARTEHEQTNLRRQIDATAPDLLPGLRPLRPDGEGNPDHGERLTRATKTKNYPL